MLRSLLTLPLLLGCADPGPAPADDTAVRDTADDGCPYPEGAVQPMALNEVLWPYAWPTALHADGRSIPLDLKQVFCNATESVDWSPHDLLLFVSIPAW